MSKVGKEMTLKELKEITENFVNGGIADEGQAVFTISYRNYFSSEEGGSEPNKYEDDFGNYDPTKYPVIYTGFGIHFETHNLSPASLEAIEKHKHLFNEFNKNEIYFSLYCLIENFDIDFDYYGEFYSCGKGGDNEENI
jgi:hypothetical protein